METNKTFDDSSSLTKLWQAMFETDSNCTDKQSEENKPQMNVSAIVSRLITIPQNGPTIIDKRMNHRRLYLHLRATAQGGLHSSSNNFTDDANLDGSITFDGEYSEEEGIKHLTKTKNCESGCTEVNESIEPCKDSSHKSASVSSESNSNADNDVSTSGYSASDSAEKSSSSAEDSNTKKETGDNVNKNGNIFPNIFITNDGSTDTKSTSTTGCNTVNDQSNGYDDCGQTSWERVEKSEEDNADSKAESTEDSKIDTDNKKDFIDSYTTSTSVFNQEQGDTTNNGEGFDIDYEREDDNDEPSMAGPMGDLEDSFWPNSGKIRNPCALKLK